ncbi:hypothetical protein ACRYJU_01265 [Alloalcanivorax xenomutans]|uniref:hypothetical protein n=1 Tax=Alloalcanivorax xenomutans TaxID=1094342 RepID=UPI000BCB1277|nr:hypothetical protein [Alloalcanivorax xenomutans]SOC09876.1 hypothetical protein SAMN05877962_1104 [Alloalcanivorax xenomutans]
MSSDSDLSILTAFNLLQLLIPFLVGVSLSAKHMRHYRVPALLVLIASVLMLLDMGYGALAPALSFLRLPSITGVFINNSIHSMLGVSTVLLLMSAVVVRRGSPPATVTLDTDRTSRVPAHRGALIATLGLISFLLPPVGLLAWILGARDLRAMREGRMATTGKDSTLVGMILGIIVCTVFILALLTAGCFILGVSSSTMLSVPSGLRTLVQFGVGISFTVLLLWRDRKAALLMFIASILVLLPMAYGFIVSLWLPTGGPLPDLALISGSVLGVLTLSLLLLLIGAAFSGCRHRSPGSTEEEAQQSTHHHGSPVLALGLVSLLAIQPLGIMAWVLGVQDLRAMHEGRMNPEGRTATLVGTVLGIISVVLFLAALSALAFTVTHVFERYRPFH